MKKTSWLLLLPLVFSVPATPVQTDVNLQDRIQRVENGLLPPVIIKGQPPVQMKLAERMNFYKTPAVSVAVINNGRIEWARGYGVREAGTDLPVTQETRFQAASISKPVAAMAALRLVMEGKLSLDENVNAKLKSWKLPENEFTAQNPVTLRRILSHSAGITVHGFPGYAFDVPLPTLQQILDGTKPANTAPIRVDIPPGSQWRYSGGGYTVMQQLVMDVTGRPFPELLKETVLDKIGMLHSGYLHPLPKSLWSAAAVAYGSDGTAIKGNWHIYPELAAAGLWTTPSDLARFAIEIQESLAGKSNKVLSQEMARQMVTVQKGDYGLGLALAGSGKAANFSHGGSNAGYRCQLVAYRETGQGAVIMTDSDSGGPLMNEVLRSIAREYGWPDYHPVEKAVAQLDPAVYSRYAGDYEGPLAGKVFASTEQGRFFVEAKALGLGKTELFPESEAQFFATSTNLSVGFGKDPAGSVVEMVIQMGAQPIKARKVK